MEIVEYGFFAPITGRCPRAAFARPTAIMAACLLYIPVRWLMVKSSVAGWAIARRHWLANFWRDTGCGQVLWALGNLSIPVWPVRIGIVGAIIFTLRVAGLVWTIYLVNLSSSFTRLTKPPGNAPVPVLFRVDEGCHREGTDFNEQPVELALQF